MNEEKVLAVVATDTTIDTKRLHVEYWPVEKLIDYARNPRRNDQAIHKMVASISEFGFTVPILAKSDGLVVDGHLRLKGARKLGMSEVPVIPCDTWTEAQVKAFRLLANRSANWATFDPELLQLELTDISGQFESLEFATGFAPEELSSYLSFGSPTQPQPTGGTPAPDNSAAANWDGMPDFEQNDLMPWKSIKVHFRTQEDRREFGILIQQRLSDKTKFVWYPQAEKNDLESKRYSDAEQGSEQEDENDPDAEDE